MPPRSQGRPCHPSAETRVYSSLRRRLSPDGLSASTCGPRLQRRHLCPEVLAQSGLCCPAPHRLATSSASLHRSVSLPGPPGDRHGLCRKLHHPVGRFPPPGPLGRVPRPHRYYPPTPTPRPPSRLASSPSLGTTTASPLFAPRGPGPLHTAAPAPGSAMRQFRGSITRPARSLCTLRSRGHPRTTQHSIPAGGQPWPGRTLTCWVA